MHVHSQMVITNKLSIELLVTQLLINEMLFSSPSCRANGHYVALKEIRLNSEEGTPFTAIREGIMKFGNQQLLQSFNSLSFFSCLSLLQ